MENYKYIIGQINGLEATKQELSNLLEDKEQMEKEQSSILTPNNKLVGVKPSKKEEPKLPKPTVGDFSLPFKMKEKTKGGIHLAETT